MSTVTFLCLTVGIALVIVGLGRLGSDAQETAALRLQNSRLNAEKAALKHQVGDLEAANEAYRELVMRSDDEDEQVRVLDELWDLPAREPLS